ncbi:MAG: Flp1 family type IVb pilin [Anaerobutyricum soehngenii]
MAFIKRKKEQMHQNNIVYKKNRLQSILLSQDGMGVVEVILIIVVLIGLVIIFPQTNIKGVVASIFSTIQKNAGSIR